MCTSLDSIDWPAPQTRCAICRVALPAEDDPRTVAYCSPRCYAREVAANPVVHIYRPAVTSERPGGDA